MGFLVVNTAMMQCTQGVAPATMIVIRPTVTACKQSAATVMDFAPTANIPPFGMCNSKTNPQVIAATIAAQGVHTPMPCLPVTTSPWTPGCKKVKIQKMAALDDASTLMCAWNGTISVKSAGQQKVKVS